ncbi:hypothetical protein PG999_003703 [Apiospora kogelbergensis]|uniref:C2H2-type domain-containing protein n=1 Tax=Apiospora kogelbergensis TaxID=1337665 RepID=A0AAW0R490_9PEZI
MEEPQSVAARTGAVESRFENIVHCIKGNERITTVSSEDVADAWDKFKLWAGNIGARQTPDSPASLESRLQGARRVLEQVVNLLGAIQEACDDLFEIASGNQENRLITSDPGLVKQDSISVRSSSFSDIDGTIFEKHEDRDLVELLLKSVGNLLRITVLIRKATPRDRFAKALQSDNPFTDAFDIAYVAEKYPKLAKSDTRWLCERLGRAITKRRQFLRYSRDHNRRISGHGDAASVALPIPPNPETEAEDEDTKSYVSAGSSFQMGSESSTLHLPTLEETISRESSWRRHAFQDLKAYVCTGEGNCDTKFFGDSRSWLDHELQFHRQQWACTLCPKGPFRGKKMFEDHLTQTHGNIVVDDLLPAFVSMGLRAVDAIPAADCPFCDEWAESLQSTTPLPDSTDLEDVIITVDPKQYRRHVSHHLEQLALFALPRLTNEHQNDNASEEANVSRSTVNQFDSPPTGNEQSADVEWDPDPPLHKAAARGDFEEVKRLINDGADVHLRGETWGSVLDAARSHPGASDSGILRFLRLELELENYEPRLTGGLPFAVPADGKTGPPESQDSKRHKCPYCEREFSRIQHLKSHRSTHTQEIPLVCPNCQMRFRRSRDLKRHGKLHAGEPGSIQDDIPGSAHIRDTSVGKGTKIGSYLLTGKPSEAATRTNLMVSVDALRIRHPGLLNSREIPSNWPSVSRRRLSNKAQPDYFEYISPADLARYDLGQGKEKQAKETEDFEDPDRISAHRYGLSRYTSEERAPPVHDTVNSPGGRSDRFDTMRWDPKHLRVTGGDESPDEKAPHLISDSEQTTGETNDAKKKHLAEPPRLKGILKKPTSEFPNPAALVKVTGVLDAPLGARWTKISRRDLDPMVLVTGNERYKVYDDFVVVQRLLSKEEVDAYIMATERLLIARRDEKKERSQRMRQEHWRLKELGTLTAELRERRRRHGSESEDENGGGDNGEKPSTSSGQPPEAQGIP